MSNLTEKWKNGELEQGYYYTKYNPKVGEPFVEIELRSYLLDLAKVRDADTVEVLAPVPSYEEWKFASEQLNKNGTWYTERSYKELKKENNKLKELLKESREWIEYLEEIMLETENIVGTNYFQRLLTRIDETLK